MDFAQQNTPENWDEQWDKEVSLEEDLLRCVQTEQEIRWRRLEKIIQKQFGGYKGLKAIEVGAGSGTYAALMAKRGADVTILDYSDKALERSAQFFERMQVSGHVVSANALDLPQELHGKYDVSMSFGLAEHFLDAQREAILRAHIELIRPGGLAIISVPNAWNIPYRLYKYSAEKRGKWGVGEEYPFTRKELLQFCKTQYIKSKTIVGDSLLNSIDYFMLQPIGRKLGFAKGDASNQESVSPEIGTPLDAYFSYSLVLCAVKG